MALIAMAVHDTDENGRSALTQRSIESVLETVDLKKHRFIISDNGSCDKTQRIYDGLSSVAHIIRNGENLGTARAINRAWKFRKPDEHAVKLDNDVYIHSSGWMEEMEAAIQRDPMIGIIGLKRKDLIQTPWHPDPNYRSQLIMLKHEPGQKWICVERTDDVIGTCTMFNAALLNKVGYSYQPGLYGFEDSLFCHRSHLAGFYNCFLNHIEIEHLDMGGGDYTQWKQDHSGERFREYHRIVHGMINGTEPIYREFY